MPAPGLIQKKRLKVRFILHRGACFEYHEAMSGIQPTYPPCIAETLERFWSHDETTVALHGTRRVAVAASGGVDSQALLFLMAAPGPHRPAWAPEVRAFHIEHGLRDGAEDLRVVGRLCDRLGVRLHKRKLSQNRIETAKGRIGSLEAALREERYRAFASMARQCKIERILTAHHRDDAAETLLLRLLRGSGLSGLGGMEVLSEMAGLSIARPLLDWSRKDLMATARSARIEWSEDPTNQDLAPMRNRVRHKILPMIEKQTDHPPASRILARTSRLLAREARVIEAVTAPLYDKYKISGSTDAIAGMETRKILAHQPPEILPYLLRRLWQDVMDSTYAPSMEHLDALADFVVQSDKAALHQMPENVVAYRDKSGRLWLYRKPRRQMSRDEIMRAIRSCSSES
jgi:tRNA(Ile)-lysidine synthase